MTCKYKYKKRVFRCVLQYVQMIYSSLGALVFSMVNELPISIGLIFSIDSCNPVSWCVLKAGCMHVT